MFNKEEYKRELFEKYSRMSTQGVQDDNSDFFKQDIKVKRYFTLQKSLEIATLFILCFGISIFAYSGANKSNKENNNENNKEINQKVEKINENLLFYNDINRTNNIDYKIIENYEEYVNFKATYDDIIEVEENDFEKYFVFIAITQGNSYISNEYVDEETLYIDITRDYENEEFRSAYEEPVIKVISTKVSNNLKRDNVIITILPLESNGFVPIKQLIERDDYTPEEAVKDGYIVTEYHYEDLKTYLLSDEKLLDDFMKKVENNEDVSIRSIEFSMGLTRFVDVKYHDGIFTTYTYYKSKADPSESHSTFAVGDYIEIYDGINGTQRDYSILDSNNGGACILCWFNL